MRLTTGIITLDIVFGALTCLLILTLRLITRTTRIPKGLRLPPGPPGKLIVGNITDLPRGSYWETFDRWANKYGELVHIEIFGQSMIFVNSLEIAHELFDKRSSIYSDRQQSRMLVDLIGMDWMMPMMSYGDRWRRYRKIFHQYFNSKAVVQYHDLQTRRTRDFLVRLHDSPTGFAGHIRHLAGGIIMEIVYGIKILPKGDPYVRVADNVVSGLSAAATPGRFLIEFLPFLKYVPEWMPGAGFQRLAVELRQLATDMSVKPFAAVKISLDAGTAQPSIAAAMLEDLSHQTDAATDEEEVFRDVTGVAYAAGADTTVSSMNTFFLAMVLHPEVQRKAQAELDTVIGNRLPNFEDLENLPYVTAVCKEVQRWHPAFPLGIGHRLTQDDVYGDYFIPKGSFVMGNAWTILHDEKIYGPNPHAFEPERFFLPGAIDPVGHFGFGRRICPGRFTADSSIFIVVASVLKVFDISPAKDSNGDNIPVKAAYSSSLLSYPEPFRCTIKSRSEFTQALVMNSVAA